MTATKKDVALMGMAILILSQGSPVLASHHWFHVLCFVLAWGVQGYFLVWAAVFVTVHYFYDSNPPRISNLWRRRGGGEVQGPTKSDDTVPVMFK